MVLRIAIVVAQHRDAELAAAALTHQLIDLDDGLDCWIVEGIDVGGTEFPGIGGKDATQRQQNAQYAGCTHGRLLEDNLLRKQNAEITQKLQSEHIPFG